MNKPEKKRLGKKTHWSGNNDSRRPTTNLEMLSQIFWLGALCLSSQELRSASVKRDAAWTHILAVSCCHLALSVRLTWIWFLVPRSFWVGDERWSTRGGNGDLWNLEWRSGSRGRHLHKFARASNQRVTTYWCRPASINYYVRRSYSI